MEFIRSFVLDHSSHEVQIIEKDGRALVRAIDIGKVLGLTTVHKSIKDFDEDEKVMTPSQSLGGEQMTTFLTRDGVYRLVMRSNKPIAKPFKKWVVNVINTIEDTGKYVLKDEVDKIKEQVSAETREQVRKEVTEEAAIVSKRYCEEQRHEAILTAFDMRTIVYIGKAVEKDGGKLIIKIGSTKDVKSRHRVFKKKYGTFLFIKCYEVPEVNLISFERFMQRHPSIPIPST